LNARRRNKRGIAEVVSVLMQGARSECTPRTCAVKTTSTIPPLAFMCEERG